MNEMEKTNSVDSSVNIPPELRSIGGNNSVDKLPELSDKLNLLSENLEREVNRINM